ncbi:MAG TPA: hypothetical protein VE268_08785, partial [Herpetosiphonaceae bacterium]|nr:hypothetical protein [Herpetosiphonaceae bacterium]
FMNMLRDEDNAKYRSVMKNTLEFDPEILKRYVNFMNNPDERTAVDQFGKDDKYFAVCTLMSTIPGLPMFGHGQVEGFREKYGMEYRRAYWDEQPDTWLIARHEREIFPLLHRRYLFSGVEHFLLYDFFSTDGSVNEDVFAYSNRAGDERSLVVVHNKYATARGWIRTSVAYSVKTGEGDERTLTQRTLGEGLGLTAQDDYFCIFRDHGSGLEFIRNSREMVKQGLYLELEAYKTNVFLDFREVQDNEWHHYANLASYLGGQGVPNIEEALRETFLQPIHYPFRELVNAGMFGWIIDNRVTKLGKQPDPALLKEAEEKMLRLLHEVKRFMGGSGDDQVLAGEIRRELEALLQIQAVSTPTATPTAPDEDEDDVAAYLRTAMGDDLPTWGTILSWLFVHNLGKIAGDKDFEQQSRSWIDEWLLGRIIASCLQDLGQDDTAAWRSVRLIKILVSQQRCFEETAQEEKQAYRILENWFQDDDVQQFVQVNRYQGILWFNKEAFDQLLQRIMVVAYLTLKAQPAVAVVEQDDEIAACYEVVKQLQQAAEESQYQVENLLAVAKGPMPSVAP